MSLLPGEICLADDRSRALARQLVDIRRMAVPDQVWSRVYQPWASPDRVPAPTTLWQRAVDELGRTDLTPDVLNQRPTGYVAALLD
jgi:hypothetical protein